MASRAKINLNFKGFNKYISQIFDDPKEEEIQIGMPTDVKHVAHIGSDGPTAGTPSWMKDYKSAPLAAQESKEESSPGGQWVSQDTKPKRAPRAVKESSESGSTPKKRDSSSKPKARRSRADSSGGNSGDSNDSTSRSLPDIPRRARRKKSRDQDGSTRPRSRAGSSSTDGSMDFTETGSALPPAGPRMGIGQNANY